MADINRVRKGLECCTGLGCHHGCEYLKKGCTQSLKMDALEIINRQQAENDRLKAELNQYHKADTFLDAHGWQWKDYCTEHYTEQLREGEQE